MRPLSKSIASIILSKRHFPKFVVASLTTCGLAGYICFACIDGGKTQTRELHDNNFANKNGSKQSVENISHEEAMVKAMIENARKSTWRENISNAAQAQERFVFPGRHDGEQQPKFVEKIMERSDEMMEQQEQKLIQQRSIEQEERNMKKLFSVW